MLTSTSSKGQPTPQSLDVKSSDYGKGAEAATIFHELLKKCVNRLPHSLFKNAISSIVNTGANYKPVFKTMAEVKMEYPTSEQVQADALYAALNKITAAEIAAMPSVVIQCHAALVETFGKESKGILRADIKYKLNDDSVSPDPTITWAAFMRTHITEREGTGTLRKVLTKVNAIASVLSISPSAEDNLVEYEERLVRRINGLKENHGFDVMGTIFKDESELALLYIFRLGQDYAPFQRDLENGIIPLPKTLQEAVVALKDRVEVSHKKHESVSPVSVFAAVTKEPRSDTRREPGAKRSPPAKRTVGFSKNEGVTTIKKHAALEPYPYMNHNEFKELSEADRLHIRAHNGAIRDAIKQMDKGRTNRPTPKEKVLMTTDAEVDDDEPTIVLMSTYQECMDLTYDDSDRSAHETSIIEVDLTINSDDGRPGNPMEASPARLIADNSLPSINLGSNEFFNLITLPINMKSRGVESSFWVVVGGEHSGDIVDSLDVATLRTTATTMALCGEHHPDGFAVGFETMELANDWQAKLYRSLLSNGWSFSTSMSAREIAGSCWVRPASSDSDRTTTAEADDEDWRKLPCVPLPPFSDHDPTDLGPYFPKGSLVPYSDSDSSNKSKQSAGSRKNLKKKEKRIMKGMGVTERTKKPHADICLPELIDSSGSESDTDSDEDTMWLKNSAPRTVTYTNEDGGKSTRVVGRGGPPRSIKHAMVDPDPITKTAFSSDPDTVHARSELQSTSETSSGDTEYTAIARNRSPSNIDGPFTRGVETTNYDDMPPGVYSDDDDDDIGPTIKEGPNSFQEGAKAPKKASLHGWYDSIDRGVPAPNRGAIRGAIRGATTMTLSPDDERA